MAYDVRTSHKIVAGGPDLMQMLDSDDLSIVATATRDAVTGVWTVVASGVPDVTAPTVNGSATPRSEAITALVNQTLAAVPEEGISVTVPHGLPETP